MATKKMSIAEIEEEYKMLVSDYDSRYEQLLSSMKECIKEFCNHRQISAKGEGICLNMDIEYNNIYSRIYEVGVEDDTIHLELDNSDCPFALDSFPSDMQLEICLECVRMMNNSTEKFEGNRGLILLREAYDYLPIPMSTIGVTDTEMQALCQDIEDELYARYNEDEVTLYLIDSVYLVHKNPHIYNKINETYYELLEKLGLVSGVIYYSDLDDDN